MIYTYFHWQKSNGFYWMKTLQEEEKTCHLGPQRDLQDFIILFLQFQRENKEEIEQLFQILVVNSQVENQLYHQCNESLSWILNLCHLSKKVKRTIQKKINHFHLKAQQKSFYMKRNKKNLRKKKSELLHIFE